MPKQEKSHILNVYNRDARTFDRGAGARQFDGNTSYLDFASGVGVNSLGHAHPAYVAAVIDQVQKISHVGNLYDVKGLEKVSATLCAASGFADKVFLCNSGAEANECGLKMMRKFQHGEGHPERHRVIVFENAFHGRTLSTIFASNKDKMIKGFGPETVSYDIVPFGDLNAVMNAVGPETAGIMLEPVQGEGGITVAAPEFLKGLCNISDEHNLVLLFDEIQSGAGRTGKFYSYQWANVCPDIVTSAKGIGNGYPVAACLASDLVAQYMTPGTHGSTYSGSPMAVRVTQTVVDVILSDGFLDDVQDKSRHLMGGLNRLHHEFGNVVQGVTGLGLMIGLNVTPEPGEFVSRARDHGLLTVPAGGNCVRLLPPLVISRDEIDEGVEILRQVAKSFTL